MKKLSFTIPCYGSALTIRDVISEIHQKMSERPELSYEIITVNDCSPDNVLDVLRSIAASDHSVKVIDLAKNGGKHAALMAAYNHSSGDTVINIDDDGQCPLDKLWELTAPVENGYDIAIARYPKKKQSAFKNFGSSINALMARHLISKPKDLCLSNFSAVKKFVIDEMLNYKNAYPYIDGLFLRTTSKIINVDMEERDRAAGTGNYTLKKSLALWFNGFTAFSVKPLRLATVLGLLCALIGFLAGIYVVVRKIIHPEILMGYSSLMAIQLFIGGMIMMMLGLIGEYIGRIYISINNSPQFVIREIINDDENEKEVNS